MKFLLRDCSEHQDHEEQRQTRVSKGPYIQGEMSRVSAVHYSG